MRALVLAVCLVLISSFAYAVDVTQVVFSITSTAATATTNLRVMPMKQKMANFSGTPAQLFSLDNSTTSNYFLTKNQTYTVNVQWGALWIQVDQDTKVYKNSETTYMILKNGVDYVLGLK